MYNFKGGYSYKRIPQLCYLFTKKKEFKFFQEWYLRAF